MKCAPGYTATPGSPECILIPENWAVDGAGKAFECPRGQYSPPGTSDCYDKKTNRMRNVCQLKIKKK